MSLFGRTIVSNQAIKAKTDKLQKIILRDAKRRINSKEIVDSHDFTLYLQTIDARYSHIIADIKNATRVLDYSKVRAEKLAEARQLLDFFTQDYTDLNRLAQIVRSKAHDAGRTDELSQDNLIPIDLTKLKEKFEILTKEGASNV